MYHYVHHAVILEIFGALKAVRQLLADGLLDDARTGKADERPRLGDMHVAKHGIGRGHAPGGRIGEHHDIGFSRFPHHLHRDRGARQLHQGQYSLLHARPAGGSKHDERRAFADRSLQTLDEGLACGHAEGASHEVEILHADDDREPFQLAEPELDGVVGSGLAARILEAIGVPALIAEPERIEGNLGYGNVDPGFVVEYHLETRRRAHAHVIVGAGDDEVVRLNILAEDQLSRFRALDPQIFRGVAPSEVIADFWPHDVGDPVHGWRLASPIASPRAVRTPRASSATSSVTDLSVRGVALSLRSSVFLSAFTSAEPTTMT